MQAEHLKTLEKNKKSHFIPFFVHPCPQYSLGRGVKSLDLEHGALHIKSDKLQEHWTHNLFS